MVRDPSPNISHIIYLWVELLPCAIQKSTGLVLKVFKVTKQMQVPRNRRARGWINQRSKRKQYVCDSKKIYSIMRAWVMNCCPPSRNYNHCHNHTFKFGTVLHTNSNFILCDINIYVSISCSCIARKWHIN